jgi:hypothetical protein
MSRIITKIKKESLTTKLTLIIVGLTAGSALLVPTTYASFHPVTTGEIADDTIRSADISNSAGVHSVDIVNGQVGSVDIGQGQVARGDIQNDAIRPNIQRNVATESMPPGSSITAIIDCPAGTILTGGGFHSEDLRLQFPSSHPRDQNTWQVAANNPTNEEKIISLHAICIGPMP